MEVEFVRSDLARLETDKAYTAGFGRDVVRGFRKVMQALRAAPDERDLYALRGLRMEKLRGRRQHQHSLRLNEQWRLIVELVGEGPAKKAKVIEIVDYH